MPQFLAQVSIYLGRHVVWLKTQRLFDQDGQMIHDGLNLSSQMTNLPATSIWQKRPALFTRWIGYWPGTSAPNGKDHLSLDPDGPCWCGQGRIYRNCCLVWEKNFYANQSFK
jgi:hypothetical protein